MVKSIGFGGCDTTDIVMCVLYQLSAEGIRTLVIDETENGELVASLPDEGLDRCYVVSRTSSANELMGEMDALVVYSGYHPGFWYNRCERKIAAVASSKRDVRLFVEMVNKICGHYELLYKGTTDCQYGWFYLDRVLKPYTRMASGKYTLPRENSDFEAALIMAYDGQLDIRRMSEPFLGYMAGIVKYLDCRVDAVAPQ